jgi:hypothetical protein
MRDVTGTVESDRPDHRLDPVEEAGRRAGGLVLDVKVGSGAFMKTATRRARWRGAGRDGATGAGCRPRR